MDILELYLEAIRSLEMVGKVRGGEEANASVVKKSCVRCHMRWPARHQCWKVSVKTDKPWGNHVDKRDIVWTEM